MLIYLIGYMGSGKTTAGKQLANHLKYHFLDMDHEIEKKMGLEVSSIFELNGESFFREKEHNLLLEISQQNNTVISTGGGTPCFFDNIDIMINTGATIYLKADPSLLVNRLSHSGDKRPLIAGKTDLQLLDFISDALIYREPFYKKAKFTVNALNLKPALILSAIGWQY